MRDVSIRARNLGKEFNIRLAEKSHGQYRTLRSEIIDMVPGLFSDREKDDGGFWALKNVSFDIKAGEVLGIIGRNGAGKSTLLRILAKIIRPTTGYAEICGSVGSLLRIGAGFHPELTGRENIYLGGSLYGMTRSEVAGHLEEIIAFSELGSFIDVPVKRYSSGMYVRLGFALATHLEREVLLIDEVLSVGDASFKQKSYMKMKEVIGRGNTVVLVSHQIGQIVKLCHRVIWLENGTIRSSGDPLDVCSKYEEYVGADVSVAASVADRSGSYVKQGDASARGRPAELDRDAVPADAIYRSRIKLDIRAEQLRRKQEQLDEREQILKDREKKLDARDHTMQE